MKKIVLLLILSFYFISWSNACEFLWIDSSSKLGRVSFRQIPLDSTKLNSLRKTGSFVDSGRPVYESIDRDQVFYLFHTVNSVEGEGRWIIGSELFQDQSTLGYIRSWAVLPYFYESSQDLPSSTSWYFTNNEDGFSADPTLTIQCINDGEKTVFFQMEFTTSPRIDGYYVERILSPSTTGRRKSVWSQIKMRPSDPSLYLFRLENEKTSKWLIGYEYGVDSAFAFCDDPSETADTVSNSWFVIDGFDWRQEESVQLFSVTKFLDSTEFTVTDIKQSLPEILKYFRNSLGNPLNGNRRTYELRNSIQMPMIGLGTGGLYVEESEDIFRDAIELGYRLFDSAREYQNERILGNVLKSVSSQLSRNHFFLETKVWPTQLGFLPTTNAILDSLNEFQTSYVDLYLLHWPECDKSIDWMHCQDTVDPKGTWRESWFALEKAYAEGRILSLGFSNANVDILNELSEIGTILPHVIQNWSELGNLDLFVREWCEEHQIIYQPYASIRNIRFQSQQIRSISQLLARKYNVTEYDVNLRFFLQTGASIIPRASHYDHLENNLRKPFEWSLEKSEMEELGWKLPIHTEL